MDNSATHEFEFLDFTDINDMERGRLLHMLYSARNDSWVSGEDGFKHPDFPWTFRGTQAQTLPPPGMMNESNITHISDWNTAADEYVNGDAEPENPVIINGGNFIPAPPPVYQMVPNAPVYMGSVPPPVHGYVPPQMSPYQPIYPGPEPPMDPNHRRNNMSRNPKGIPPPVKRNNDMTYRHPDNIEMANYQTPPTYIAVPPPHYYYSPQNSPLYLPPHPGHPTYPMYTHPHPTLYNPYQQTGPPMYHSPPAGQVPQQPLLVESCKPNVNSIPPVHNIYPQVPENIVNETPLDSEIISIQQDKEGELHVQQPEHVEVENIEVNSEEPTFEMIVNVKEVPNTVETILPIEHEKNKELGTNKTKRKKEVVSNGPADLFKDNIIVEKNNEKDIKEDKLISVEEVKDETSFNEEQIVPPVSISPAKLPEVPEVEPVEPVKPKTWAGLFSGCTITSNDKVFTLHGSSQSNSNAHAEPIVMPSRSLADNTIRSSVFLANNQKHGVPIKPRPSSSNSLSSVDDNTIHLQRLGDFLAGYNLDHKTAHLQPRGLTNRNTRCYINATLQALLTCPPFFNLMRSVQYKLKNRNSRGTQKSPTPILESMVQFIGEFQQLSFKNGKSTQQQRQATSVATQETPDTGSPFEPNYVYKILPAFEDGRQEDAEEFMSYLLNGINDEMIELIKMSKSNINNDDTQTEIDSIDDNNEWKEVNGKHKMVTRRTIMEKTPLSEIFRGQLRTRTVKNGENEPTENIEPFFTLKLDIEKAKSVREALDILVTKDTLEGFTCSKTNREVDAYQQVTIDELPYVLLLHLKCFEYKQQKLTKIVKNVEFSVDLKIEPKLISKNSKNNMKTRQYKLFAVVYHDGKEATKGHYFADVFYVALGRWLRFDDASVRFVMDKEVCQPKPPCMPYLLYYRRNDTIAALSAFDNKGR